MTKPTHTYTDILSAKLGTAQPQLVSFIPFQAGTLAPLFQSLGWAVEWSGLVLVGLGHTGHFGGISSQVGGYNCCM